MRKLVVSLGLVAATVAFSGSAFAQAAPPPAGGGGATVAPNTTAGAGERPNSAVEVGLRAGFAIPMGDTAESSPLSDIVSGVIPIQLDAGYKITQNILVGAFFSYGIGMANSDKCKDCSINQLRFGAQAHYHFIPTGQFDPWAGLGIGYEILNETKNDSSVKGLEFVQLQGGADYRVNGNLGVGPFLGFSLGQYSTASAKGNSADIPKTAMHQFLTIGIRGIYDIGL